MARPHRSPGWIKAREERSRRRAEDPVVQQRKRGHLSQALEEKAHRATRERVAEEDK
jgi:hypothetical protein